MENANSPVRVNAPVPNLLRDTLVYYSGRQACPPGHQWGPGTRDHYLLHVVLSGAGTFGCAGQGWSLTAGGLFLIRPGAVVEYAADARNPWTYRWIAFNGPQADALLRAAGFSGEPVRHCGEEFALASDACLAKLDGTSGLPGAARLLADLSVLYALLSMLVQRIGRGDAGPPNREMRDVHIQNALEFIDRNYTHEVSVSEWAAYVGIDRSHLTRLFRQVMNTTPSDYLLRLRISKARDLLLNTALAVKEIAFSTGFADPLYFSKCFRKLQGCSPTDLRKK